MIKTIIALLLLPSLCFAGGYHRPIPGPQGPQGIPGENAQDKKEVFEAIQHHFSPIINKWQGSISGATDFKGSGAAGLSAAKTVCSSCGDKILLHGNVITDFDESTAYGVGATFTWDW